MAFNDVMLDCAGAAVRGLVEFRSKHYFVSELIDEARSLQNKAMRAKLGGQQKEAVQLYRELIPYLVKLEDLGVFGSLGGLPVQIAKRTIEQLEEAA